jgi:hypothetical protein
MTENICALCRFCTFEKSHNSFVCHNEDNETYGRDLDNQTLKTWACDGYTPHTHWMPLKEALEINTRAAGTFYHHKLPGDNTGMAFITLGFKTNADLEAWKDAHMSLFVHWLEMAGKDGDIEEGKE